MALNPERCPIGLNYYYSPMIVGSDPYAAEMLADSHYGVRFDATFNDANGMRLNPISPYDLFESKTHSNWNQITLSSDFWIGFTTKCHYYNGWTNTVSLVIKNTSGNAVVGITIYHHYGGPRKVLINLYGISGSSLVYEEAHILGDVFKIEYRKQGGSVFFYLNDTLMQEFTYNVTGSISNTRPILELYSDGTYPMSRNWVKDIYVVSSTAGTACQGLVPPDPIPSRVVFPHRILENKTILGFKLQQARNVLPTFATADYGNLVDEVVVDVVAARTDRKISRGDYSREKSISGKVLATVNFRVPLYATDSPKWIEYLQACGWGVTTDGDQKVLRPISSSLLASMHVLMSTDEIDYRQAKYDVVNAIGSARLLVEDIEYFLLFTFTGELRGITTLTHDNAIVPTGFDTAGRVQGHIVTIDNKPVAVDYCEFTSEADVEMQSNASHYGGVDGALYIGKTVTSQVRCVRINLVDPDCVIVPDDIFYEKDGILI